MLVAAIMWAFVQSVHCQLPDHPKHETIGDFYDSLRILRVKVLYYDPATGILDAKFEDTKKIEVMQFQVTRSTTMPGPPEGDIMVIYCAAKHGTGLNERIKYLLQIEKAK